MAYLTLTLIFSLILLTATSKRIYVIFDESSGIPELYGSPANQILAALSQFCTADCQVLTPIWRQNSSGNVLDQASSRSDMVFIHGQYQYSEVESSASKYSNVRYVILDAMEQSSHPRILAASFSSKALGFLAGAAAASFARTKSKRIGALVVHDGLLRSAADSEYLQGFSLAAQAFCGPDCTLFCGSVPSYQHMDSVGQQASRYFHSYNVSVVSHQAGHTGFAFLQLLAAAYAKPVVGYAVDEWALMFGR